MNDSITVPLRDIFDVAVVMLIRKDLIGVGRLINALVDRFDDPLLNHVIRLGVVLGWSREYSTL